jgi:pyrimidine-nucleoside phosphorylase
LIETITADRTGYITAIAADEIGVAVVELGGGREKKGEAIDHSVGVVMHARIGDAVEEGQPLYTVHANSGETKAAAIARINHALTIMDEPVESLPLFYERVA